MEFDKYSGDTSVTLEATDFFRVDRIGGRWWMVTPEGHPFYSMGVNYTTPEGDVVTAFGYAPYNRNILARYGSVEGWAEAVAARYRGWGFNSLGGWSTRDVHLPEFEIIFYSHERWRDGGIMDFFSQEFLEYVEETAKEKARPDDSLFAGYFIDNEMQWESDWRRGPSIFNYYLQLPAGAAGKKEFVDFMKSEYGTIEKMSETWEPAIENWNKLAEITKLSPKSNAAGPATDTREKFTLAVARQYYKTTTSAVRRYDQNHIIAGSRFFSWLTPAAVVVAAGEYCDIISINHYEVGALGKQTVAGIRTSVPVIGGADPSFAAWSRVSGRPLMLTEFSFRAEDSGLPNTIPPPNIAQPTVPNQKVRAERYKKYVEFWAGSPYFTGHHWFRLMDEPKEGRWDGENGNYGLVNIEDDPYEEFVAVVKETNAGAWDKHRNSSPPGILADAVVMLRKNLNSGKAISNESCLSFEGGMAAETCSFAAALMKTIRKPPAELVVSKDSGFSASPALLAELRNIADSKIPLIGTGVPGVVFKVELAPDAGGESFTLKLWP